MERHALAVEKLRNALNAGALPIGRIKRPKGMDTRDFIRRKENLKRHERELKRKLTIYLLQ